MARAVRDGRDRIEALALGDDHIAARAGRDLGGDQLGGHAAAAEARNAATRHRLDLGGDGGDVGNMHGGGIARGIGGIKPVHIRQQNQFVGAHHGGDARAQPVIVAEADFRRRHRVILVDHRHGAQNRARC